jgi:hypothetical protein
MSRIHDHVNKTVVYDFLNIINAPAVIIPASWTAMTG